MSSSIHSDEKAYEAIHDVHRAMAHIWKDQVLFTWRWWLGVAFAIVPWAIWLVLRKKESMDRLLYAGVVVILISTWFDFIGIALGLWYYTNNLVPTTPPYVPWDFSVIPVTIMLFLQYKPSFNPLIKSIAFAGITAFAGEPFFKWLGLYEPKGWRYVYSFAIFIVIYFVAHTISRRKGFSRL